MRARSDCPRGNVLQPIPQALHESVQSSGRIGRPMTRGSDWGRDRLELGFCQTFPSLAFAAIAMDSDSVLAAAAVAAAATAEQAATSGGSAQGAAVLKELALLPTNFSHRQLQIEVATETLAGFQKCEAHAKKCVGVLVEALATKSPNSALAATHFAAQLRGNILMRISCREWTVPGIPSGRKAVFQQWQDQGH